MQGQRLGRAWDGGRGGAAAGQGDREHGRGTSHVVQLFDEPDSRADAVAEFVREGLARGETVLVLASLPTWAAVAERLEPGPFAESVSAGHLVVVDAGVALARAQSGDIVDPTRFEVTIGALVRDLSRRRRPLRAYGELVDLLAAQGRFRDALIVEHLWNTLAGELSFALFCGYDAVNFGDPNSAGWLRAICAAHTCVHSNPRDVLSTFLLRTTQGEGPQLEPAWCA